MPLTAVDLALRPWLRKLAWSDSVTTSPVVSSVSSSSVRLAGGGTIVITGQRFRLQSTGLPPTVRFGNVVATGVVLNGPTSISVTIPAGLAQGSVSISVQIDSELGTLPGAFLYFIGSLTSVSPNFTVVTSGPQISVVIKGFNLIPGATFTFDGLPATDVTFIDETQYVVTVPPHPAGTFVDVVMIEPGGATFTLRRGFKYSLFTHGADIRRMPGIGISEKLGGTANQCHFRVDGGSSEPQVGEEVHIADEGDGNRTLFRGNVQQAELTYESGGEIDQLYWDCVAIDFTYLLNRRRPFGRYVNVSATEVVLDLMRRYGGQDFDINTYVQTNLALVTVSFDGTQTLGQAFDTIAKAIGGGRWYLDYDRKLHFFHPKVTPDIVLPISPPSGADFTAAVLSVGALIGGTLAFEAAYYLVRVTFLYSNGAESRLGPGSNVVGYDGKSFIHIASLPIGLDPSATITCVGRKIYYLKGSNALASGWTVLDNTTTVVDVYPDMTDTATVIDNAGDPVTIPDGGGSSGTGGTTTPPPPGVTQQPGTTSVSGSGGIIFIGGVYLAGGRQPINAFQLFCARSYATYEFAVAAVYPIGDPPSQSLLSGISAGHVMGSTGLLAGGTGFVYTAGPAAAMTFTTNGFDIWMSAVPRFPPVGTLKPYLWRVYSRASRTPAPGAGGGWNDVTNAPWIVCGDVPYFEETQADGTPIDPITGLPMNPSIPLSSGGPTDGGGGLGDQPIVDPTSQEPTLVWPNPDGPYLENFAPPDDIDNLNMVFLYEDAGQKFVPSKDITQIRNRVKVFGAGTVTTVDAPIGAVQVGIADPSVFSPSGGTVLAGNGQLLKFFSVSSAIVGSANLLLTTPLQIAILAGTVVEYFCQVDDVDSQKERGAVELNKFGQKTDGIHEYVVRDTNLRSIQEVYLRAHAEIELYSKPIVTVKYSTRDTKTRVGAIVHVDLTYPPCYGDFLIQSVDIDQIRDEGDAISPRYTVTATSVLFDLTSFLMIAIQGGQSSGGGGGGNVGIVAAATGQAAAAAPTIGSIIDNLRGGFTYSFLHANGNIVTIGATASPPSFLGATQTNVIDSRGAWQRSTSGAVTGNQAGYQQSGLSLLPEHQSVMLFYMRTGPLVSNMKLWICYTSGAKPGNNDVPSMVSYGLRLFSGCLQLYAQPVGASAPSLVLGESFPTLEASQEYEIRLATINAGATIQCRISSPSSALPIPKTLTLALPAAMLGVNFFPTVDLITNENVAKTLDFLRIGLESGLLL